MHEPKFIAVKLSQLVRASWNYKTDDPELLQKLIAGIKRNGQVVNLIVRPIASDKYEVVNGNHRLDAMLTLYGPDGLAACCDLGNISLRHAQRIAIETNDLYFDNDEVKLADTIRELQEDFDTADLATTMPYSPEQLKDFRDMTSFDWASIGKDIGPIEEGRKVICPECGGHWIIK